MLEWLTRWIRRPPPVREKRKATARGGNPLTHNAGGFLADSAIPALAREELRHIEGEVWGNASAIAKRIAGQAVCVGHRKTATGPGRRGKALRLPTSMKAAEASITPVDAHPLLDALRDPNPLMVHWSLLYLTVMQLQAAGLSYWWLVQNGDHEEIWPIPPSWIRPEHDDDMLYARYFCLPPQCAAEFEIPAEDMIPFRLPHPADPIFGTLSPLQALAKTVVCDEQILTAQYRGHKNGINPGLALTVGRHPDVPGVPGQRPHLTDTQRNQLLTAVRKMYQGAYANEEPFILDGLIEDIKKISNTPKEMAFLDSANMTRDRLAEGFGVNPIVRGRVEGANRASAAAADQQFCDSTVNPLVELLSQTLTKYLAPRYGERLCIWIEPANSFDPDEKRADLSFLRDSGCLTKNQLLAEYGYPPMKGPEGEEIAQSGGGALLGARSFRRPGN